MKKLPLFVFAIIILSSCNDNKLNQKMASTRIPIDVKNFVGNAIIFTEIEQSNTRIYIIPSQETDSNTFKNIDVLTAIKNKICIQLNTGCFTSFLSDSKKNILKQKVCNLPYDTMNYVKVFLEYKNYQEVIISPRDKNGNLIKIKEQDSCNTKVITETENASFKIVRVYSFPATSFPSQQRLSLSSSVSPGRCIYPTSTSLSSQQRLFLPSNVSP